MVKIADSVLLAWRSRNAKTLSLVVESRRPIEQALALVDAAVVRTGVILGPDAEYGIGVMNAGKFAGLWVQSLDEDVSWLLSAVAAALADVGLDDAVVKPLPPARLDIGHDQGDGIRCLLQIDAHRPPEWKGIDHRPRPFPRWQTEPHALAGLLDYAISWVLELTAHGGLAFFADGGDYVPVAAGLVREMTHTSLPRRSAFQPKINIITKSGPRFRCFIVDIATATASLAEGTTEPSGYHWPNTLAAMRRVLIDTDPWCPSGFLNRARSDGLLLTNARTHQLRGRGAATINMDLPWMGQFTDQQHQLSVDGYLIDALGVMRVRPGLAARLPALDDWIKTQLTSSVLLESKHPEQWFRDVNVPIATIESARLDYADVIPTT